VKIGSAVAGWTQAHKRLIKAAKAAHVAKLELIELSKQVDALKKQFGEKHQKPEECTEVALRCLASFYFDATIPSRSMLKSNL